MTQKRFIVTNPYPNSPFRVGDILELVAGREERWENNRTGMKHNICPADYKSIFRELSWWEYREEMPEYVKYCIGDKTEVCKIIGYKNGQGIIDDTHVITLCNDVLPATKSEYTAYINMKK